MSSYQYRKSHCGDKTVVRSSYLHNGIFYTGKMASLYWINPQVPKQPKLQGMAVLFMAVIPHKLMQDAALCQTLSLIITNRQVSVDAFCIRVTGRSNAALSCRPAVYIVKTYKNIMTSWHRDIFQVSGPLLAESTGHWWIPLTNGQW